MVFEILNIGHVAVNNLGFHGWFFVELAIVTVTLHIGFGYQPDTIFVAQLVPARINRMASALP